ncbi:uncharacterized protein RCH25_025318 [Pelodytes ibericus]
MTVSNKLVFAFTILSVVSYICTVIFNALSAIAQKGLFYATGSNISGKYSLDVTPAGWTFSIWSVIYIWNGLWIIYAFSTLFRRKKQDYIYVTPGIHPPGFFAVWIINNVINIGWLFLWDREYLVLANVFLVLLPATCFMMLYMSYKHCYKHREQLEKDYKFDLWCTRILVHNGLATYATWTTIATALNFGIVLKYYLLLQDPGVSNVVLCIIFFALAFWFLLETCVFEKYVRYTFTIYPVAIIAAAGVYLGREPSSVMSEKDLINIVIIAASSAACLLRFVLLFTCDILGPLFSKKNVNTQNSYADIPGPTTEFVQSNGHTNPIALEIIET